MIPDHFREFDRVARESFSFLVQERGFATPTVEYWRDHFLTYEFPNDLALSVGTERGIGTKGWLGVFINVVYRNKGHVLFPLSSVLKELGIPLEAAELAWPSSIKEYAAVVKEHFEAIVGYVRSHGLEKAKQGPGSGAQGSSLVVRGADGSAMRGVCLGAGVHFWGSQFLPIDVETFWKIVEKNHVPSYVACACPSCGYVGNVGTRQTSVVSLAKIVELILLSMGILSVAGCVVVSSWRQSEFQVPVTAALFVAWFLSRIVKAKLAQSGFMALCPQCGYVSKATEFTVEGLPPTIADHVNPLRLG